MQHRGQIVEKVIRRSGFGTSGLARGLGVSRNTVYNYYSYQDLSWDIISRIGKIIGHDFTEDFPELLRSFNTAEEEKFPYGASSIAQYIKERDTWKDKYIKLLEDYNKLLASVSTSHKTKNKKGHS